MNLIEGLGGLVYGVGVNDRSRPAYIKNKATKEYEHWTGMLERCYGKNKHITSRKTYKDCKCSENFKSYSYFYDWCQNQVGFNNADWHLDKDFISTGNKIYSEGTCFFIPQDLNAFISNKRLTNKSGATGVYFHKASGKYSAQINFNGKRKHLGLFETVSDAEKNYLMVRGYLAKDLAKKFRDVVDGRVVEVLLNRFSN